MAALAALAAAGGLARRRPVSTIEQRIFRTLNRSAGAAERPVWVVMQLGNGLVAAAAPLVARAAGCSWADAGRVGLAAGGGWQLAKLVKASVARERPAALLPGVVLRDGDPSGRGFVSGHATVAMSVALAARPLVDDRGARLLLVLAICVGLARVHVGAHLPLDVAGAMALAALWGPACAPPTAGRHGRRPLIGAPA